VSVTVRCPSVTRDYLAPVWSLDPAIRHLNHGSFGAVPVPVQEVRRRWLDQWERRPTGFVYDTMQPALDEARSKVAGFVGGSADGLAFVRNASTGIASVVRSFEPRLGPGDEILTTSHDYNAVRQTLAYTADRTGARVVVADVPYPIADRADVIEAIVTAVGPRTRLAVVDHISSPTGVVFPIEDIVAALEPDVPVVVDGAHGPGQVPLDLDTLGASWYAGNLHKWVCAPRGSAFLHTRADRLDETHPVVISHGWNDPRAVNRYHALFDWLGTDDMTAWLAAPEAIRVIGEARPGGWPEVMRRNHELALSARDLICARLGQEPSAPDDMVGSMASFPMPDLEEPASGMSPLTFELLREGFEVPVVIWPEWPRHVLRISAHLYNELDEYEALAKTLSGLAG
jgi:isopenicillin-N epimerase